VLHDCGLIGRQIHRQYLSEIVLRILHVLLLAYVLSFHGLADRADRADRHGTNARRGRRVDAGACRAGGLRFYATAAGTVTGHLGARLGLLIGRGHAAGHGVAGVASAVSVHVAVDGTGTAAAHVMAHVVPGVGAGRGCGGRRGAPHVTAVGDVLLIDRRIVHHVRAVRHVAGRHLAVQFAAQLRLRRRGAGARLMTLVHQHAADAGNGAAERELVLLQQCLCLASGPILVVGMLLHVDGAQTFRLVDERPLVGLAQ